MKNILSLKCPLNLLKKTLRKNPHCLDSGWNTGIISHKGYHSLTWTLFVVTMIGETLGKTWKTTFKLANSIESIYTSKTYN